MDSKPKSSKRKWPTGKIVLLSVGMLLVVAGFLVYVNFNKLVSLALNKTFESSLFSEVYTLKFENLRVDLIGGNIGIYNVILEPKANPSYPYINSTITLKTEGLKLENVDIRVLLESNELILERISITKPTVHLEVNSLKPILFPFKTSDEPTKPGGKKTLDSYLLQEFELLDASLSVVNTAKKRDFAIENFTITFRHLLIDQNAGEDLISLKNMDISMENFLGNLEEDPLKHLKFSEFKLNFDSVEVQNSLDTLIFQFRDFSAGIDSLDIHTKDSLFHVKMGHFDLAYLDQSIQMSGLVFKPNFSNAEIQKNYKFQQAHFSGTISSLNVTGMDFNSMIYDNRLFVEEIALDSVSVAVYKDNTKPKDLQNFPEYLSQTIAKIETPVRINTVKATNVNLTNEERKPDGTTAKVHISQGTASVFNITNQASNEELKMQATALLAGQVQSRLDLKFSYLKPEFSFEGRLSPFELSHLNSIIKAYSPAEIKSGTADEIFFSGTATRTGATGTMKFLYHGLQVDLKLKEQAKWKSSLVTFGVNTALLSNNPVSEGAPERTVRFKAERDMNKGFINLIIKSALNGMKETMVMSSENRREFNQLKRETRREAKKEAKQQKLEN